MSIELHEADLNGQRIAVVDDDNLFRESLCQNLIDSDFNVIDFGDGESALTYLLHGNPADLVLLDWKMPGMNGIEVLRRLRSSGCPVPVIFLTALSDQIFEEAALQGGAIDFVEKSRSFGILRKRIDLSLVRPKPARDDESRPNQDDSVLRQGPLELKLDTNRAYWRSRQLEISLTEFKILQLLSARAGKDVSYRAIYDVVHGSGFVAGPGTDGYRTNVRAFIKRIRQRFREIDDNFDQIENYPGFGYRWRPDPDHRD
jgi:two-component system response regulator ChvI